MIASERDTETIYLVREMQSTACDKDAIRCMQAGLTVCSAEHTTLQVDVCQQQQCLDRRRRREARGPQT